MPHAVDRRRFVLGLLATNALRCAGATPFAPKRRQSMPQGASHHQDEPQWLLLGTHDGEGIYRAQWNSATGTLGPANLAIATPQPTFITRHPHLPVVYACNETDLPTAAVSAFTLDSATATLLPLAAQPTGGAAPCFASVDRTGHLLFSANYGGGSLSTFRLDNHGAPASAATVFQCAGAPGCGAPGPVKDRQDGPHLHCAILSPDNRHVLACDLGDDSILVFPIHPGTAQPTGAPVRIAARPGSGPRHLAFHPNGRWLYCIHELDCTVGLLHWLPNQPGKCSYVPDGFVSVQPEKHLQGPGDAPNTAAEIALTRDGRFAYTSTRSADVLTVFAINALDGRLQQFQQLPCGGKTPRFFALDPTERWLLCAHQGSDTVTVFARDTATGTLKPANTYPAPNPECLLWV